MPESGLKFIDHTVQETNEWLNDIMDEIGYKDRQIAYHALRIILHAIRDRIIPEEAAKFAAQLPTLIRGIFYEGYTPAGKPVLYSGKEEFLKIIGNEFTDFGGRDPVEMSQAVFNVLNKHISLGEIKKIRQCLPKQIRELWVNNLCNYE